MSAHTRRRVLGVAGLEDVRDWQDPSPSGKWSQFYASLAEHWDFAGMVHPRLSRAQRYANLARSFHPVRSSWKARASFNRGVARQRERAVERELAGARGSYDVVMQLQTLFAPGAEPERVPYAIYTDNTMALTQRHYPQWAPLSRSRAEWWTGYEARICTGAAAVYTLSEFTRGSVIEDYGCAPERVLSVGAGANQALESIDGKDYSQPRALFVGLNFERKGGPTLLRAWPLVREAIPEAELAIAGPEHPGGELPEGVRWLGPVDRARLDELYGGACVFVLPSLYEPFGFVFFEAMGYGVPCIGTDCCAMPEIIDDGVTGRLVARGEHEPLAQALIEMLSDPVATAAMGRAAHESVLHAGRWPDVAARVVAHLDGVMA